MPLPLTQPTILPCWLTKFDSQILKLTSRSPKSTYTGEVSNPRGTKMTLRGLRSDLKLTLIYQIYFQRSKMIPKCPKATQIAQNQLM